MGVGTIGIVEQDIVEITNLQRQVLYTEGDLGKPKIEVVLERLKGQNSSTNFKPFDTFLTRHNALEIIAQFDIVVDGSDNFPTRYLINDACVILKNLLFPVPFKASRDNLVSLTIKAALPIGVCFPTCLARKKFRIVTRTGYWG